MIKLFEMFAGYGGASFALKKIGVPHEVVGYSEIDKYAIQCWNQNHVGENFGDCTKINPNDLPDFDLLCGGFPCQSFSVAGKGLGELDTRGTLFYEIIRIAEVKKPKYMLLENVKGLTFKTHKATFDKILSELNRIGYGVMYKVLNTKDYGIPQNRERIFFVCKLGGWEFGEFKFPEPTGKKLTLSDILLDVVDDKYYLTDSQLNTLKRNFGSKGQELDVNKISNTLTTSMGTGGGDVPYITNKSKRECGFHEESPALCARDYKDPKIIRGRPKLPYENGKRELEFKEYTDDCPALSTNPASGDQKNIVFNKQFRKLTPTECFRLMGFVNDEINLDGLSDTQRYKLAGNGWDINLVSLIFKEMFKKTSV